MSARRSFRSRPIRAGPTNMASNTCQRSARLSGAVAPSGSVTVSRSSSDSPEESKRSIRLTVKMPSSKLREVTSGGKGDVAPAKRTVNIFTENPIITGPRNSRSKKKIVEVDTSDDGDLEDQEEDEVDDEDAPGGDGEDMDADGDVDMDDAPPRQPVSKRNRKSGTTSAATPRKVIKSVEAKEMDLDDDDEDDDEELSELESEADGDPEEQEGSRAPDEMANANGEDEELDEEDEEDEEDEGDVDTDQATPATVSRTSTPDYSRLTKRQRGSLGNDFLQLPMGECFSMSSHAFPFVAIGSHFDRAPSQETFDGRGARYAPR